MCQFLLNSGGSQLGWVRDHSRQASRRGERVNAGPAAVKWPGSTPQPSTKAWRRSTAPARSILDGLPARPVFGIAPHCPVTDGGEGSQCPGWEGEPLPGFYRTGSCPSEVPDNLLGVGHRAVAQSRSSPISRPDILSRASKARFVRRRAPDRTRRPPVILSRAEVRRNRLKPRPTARRAAHRACPRPQALSLSCGRESGTMRRASPCRDLLPHRT
jgi:hypothetical protein